MTDDPQYSLNTLPLLVEMPRARSSCQCRLRWEEFDACWVGKDRQDRVIVRFLMN